MKPKTHSMYLPPEPRDGKITPETYGRGNCSHDVLLIRWRPNGDGFPWNCQSDGFVSGYYNHLTSTWHVHLGTKDCEIKPYYWQFYKWLHIPKILHHENMTNRTYSPGDTMRKYNGRNKLKEVWAAENEAKLKRGIAFAHRIIDEDIDRMKGSKSIGQLVWESGQKVFSHPESHGIEKIVKDTYKDIWNAMAGSEFPEQEIERSIRSAIQGAIEVTSKDK